MRSRASDGSKEKVPFYGMARYHEHAPERPSRSLNKLPYWPDLDTGTRDCACCANAPEMDMPPGTSNVGKEWVCRVQRQRLL